MFEIAFLPEEQIQEFQSDFRIVADFFRQQRENKRYVPAAQTIRHVDAVMKWMDVFGKTIEFSKAAAVLQKQEKEVYGMQDVMEWLTGESRAEGIAEGQKKGRVSVYYNLRKLGYSQKEALNVTELTEADVKEYPQEQI